MKAEAQDAVSRLPAAPGTGRRSLFVDLVVCDPGVEVPLVLVPGAWRLVAWGRRRDGDGFSFQFGTGGVKRVGGGGIHAVRLGIAPGVQFKPAP